MRWFQSLLILLVCQNFVHGAETEPEHEESNLPNVVIIMADDLGYSDVGCYGCVDFETPHIDALAKRGVRCTSGYVSHPYCSPSRAGLLSGKYQQSFGHEHNPSYDEGNDEIGIDVSTKLLPHLMAEAGYETGLVGKWHLGAGEPFRPAVRGFTEFYGFLGGGHHYFKVNPNGLGYDSPIWRDAEKTNDQLTYLTDDLTGEAERFLDRNQANQFCLLLMYNAPHAPDHVTNRYMDRVANIEHMGRRRYAALVQGVDEGVGRIVAKLAKLNLSENTLVVFLSDNGGRRGVSDNRPLRGNKGWLHEGGIRVPFVLSMPGTLPEETTYDEPVIALDLLPTAMKLGGVEVPANCDGVDLLPFLQGKSEGPPHETLYWRVSGGKGFAVRKGDWKLIRDIGMNSHELYNLSTDLAEDQDQSSNHFERVVELMGEYETWDELLETPRWKEGHTKNTLNERAAAEKAGTRQWPMPWIDR